MTIKLLAALLTFFASAVGGLIPILSRDNKKPYFFLYYGESFARGIFLSVGIIHLLAESEKSFTLRYPTFSYPLVFTLCVITIFFLRLIEQSASKFAKNRSFSQIWSLYLLLIVLSIHSLIEGAVLGISNMLSQIIIIFIAVISHKSATAFALSISMRTHSLEKKFMITLLLIFSLMTPIGIITSSTIEMIVSNNSASLAQSIFEAIAAGTFIYLGTFKTTRFNETHQQKIRITPTLFFGIGVALMAVVQIFI